MKKLFVVLGLLLIATMLFVGCKGKTDNSTTTQNQLPPQNNNMTGTLQGKIMNAVTGVAIGNDANSDLKIWLIQGTSDRGPDKLITDNNNPLVGEYAFSGIPVDLNLGNAKFKIYVVKAGYQAFSADVELHAIDADFINTNTFDAVINKIGNIYLFPLGSTAGDVLVHVSALGTPVPNATVILQQDASNNANVAITGNVLAPTAGLISSFTVTTDASGVATFSGANLVLGGQYNAIAEAMLFEGMQLASSQTGTFIVGTSATNQYIAMTSLTAALFATSASNQVPGTITSTGILAITLNQPIILSTTTFGAVATSGTLTAPFATGALSADGMTLTITPNFSTAPSTTANGASITYSYAGTIFLKNTQAASGVTFSGAGTDLTNSTTGLAVSRTVQMISN